MDRSLFSELYFNVFRSGNRLNMFIGINVIVFLVIGLVNIFDGQTGFATTLVSWLAMPADVERLLYRFWTPFTYMFSHQGLFHLLFNMLVLYWFGRIFLDFLNKRQFTLVYISGGLLGALWFILGFNLFPDFRSALNNDLLIGASGSVMAVVLAAATLVPNYSVSLLFIGEVKIKWLALIYVVVDILGLAGMNPGGSMAHLGGGLMGYIFIRLLQNGNDLSKLFQRGPKLKKVAGNAPAKTVNTEVNQEEIDRILDKISQSGYDSLSAKEKEQLFKASK